MDKNFWIVLGCLVGFTLIVALLTKLAGLKLTGGGLIKPETEKEEDFLSEEIKNRSAVDAALDLKRFPVSFEMADAVAEKIAKLFGGENGQEWFAGACAMDDEKYGHIVELRIYSEALELTPNQRDYFPDVKEIDGVQIWLHVVEGKMPVALEKVNALLDKLVEMYEERSWVTYIGPMLNDKRPNMVLVGFDPEMLKLKPDDFETFTSIKVIDGVHVCFMPLERAVALAEGAIKEKEE